MADVSPLNTLFLPFDGAALSWADKALFLGARAHPHLKKADLWQPFKPFADALPNTSPDLPDGAYDLVLCLVPKSVGEAKCWLAAGASRLNAGGILVAAAANDANGTRLEKWFEEMGFENLQSDSKNKARVVWAVKKKLEQNVISSWIENGTPRKIDDDFISQPGLFSWDRIDPASQFLTEHFPPALSGHVGDFGAGWGYLSRAALSAYPKITAITLIEADHRALFCAQKNLESFALEKNFLWHDATKTLPASKPFDYIIMNPPFHTGKKTDISLGQSIIANAAAMLKKGGSLSLVANTHLPYEGVLDTHLKNTKLVAQAHGFKILRAVK